MEYTVDPQRCSRYQGCVMLTLVLRKFILVDTLVYVRLEAGRVVKKQEG